MTTSHKDWYPYSCSPLNLVPLLIEQLKQKKRFVESLELLISSKVLPRSILKIADAKVRIYADPIVENGSGTNDMLEKYI
ncbi:MAG: hypothetical protein WBZ36_13580 [Candidatus Nitrosopolaris sp.]